MKRNLFKWKSRIVVFRDFMFANEKIIDVRVNLIMQECIDGLSNQR